MCPQALLAFAFRCLISVLLTVGIVYRITSADGLQGMLHSMHNGCERLLGESCDIYHSLSLLDSRKYPDDFGPRQTAYTAMWTILTGERPHTLLKSGWMPVIKPNILSSGLNITHSGCHCLLVSDWLGLKPAGDMLRLLRQETKPFRILGCQSSLPARLVLLI